MWGLPFFSFWFGHSKGSKLERPGINEEAVGVGGTEGVGNAASLVPWQREYESTTRGLWVGDKGRETPGTARGASTSLHSLQLPKALALLPPGSPR